ncbi:type II secretion system protein GspL [Tahibacter amnicola]|uniref:Type II secretion system protein L n=1 Tax=Tahibacter amnicola TaxID=2976241 RepID=A0ABY6BBZ5_9GAMM|nr:type II secretion system protein GspL [Tahibacter amnicola]UXI67563.1 type II secretion system protein GspL [Tahibacter amnicola]
MSHRLLVRWQAEDRWSWLAQGADGKALGATVYGAPPEHTIAQAREIVVLVPAAQVLLLEAAAVTRQRAQLIKAVPYALEDQLAQPVEELHFALAGKVEQGRVGVGAVAHATLKAWLTQLSEAGIRPDVLIPESLALPVGGLLVEGDGALLRLASWRAAALEPDFLLEWLEMANDGSLPPLEVFDSRLAARLHLPVPVTAYHERQRDVLGLLAERIGAEPVLNLLQGEYAPRHRTAPVARWWRLAAVLAGAAILLTFAQMAVERYSLSRQSQRLDDAMRAVLLQSFPEMEKVAGDPAALMKSAMQRLGDGAGTGGLLHILGQIAPIIGSTTRLTTRSVEFRNGTLELAISAPDVPTLDSIRERLATVPGVQVELTAVNQSQGGVDGRLRLTGGTK